MMHIADNPKQLVEKGFAIADNIYSPMEVASILDAISISDTVNPAFRKSKDLFAIRRFLLELPAVQKFIFNEALLLLISQVCGKDYFVVKSIYFDKPPDSNWFVAYHQDLTISVEKKVELKGYGPWTVKQNYFSVQPPLPVLENMFTVRIHLDSADENNGALKVLVSSHLNGVQRGETIDYKMYSEELCAVEQGGVMMMKPLLFHASGKTTNKKRRRVIHLELSKSLLPEMLQWSEKVMIPFTLQ